MLPRKPLRRAAATGFAGAVLATTLFGPPASTAGAATSPPPARPASAHTVTLLTGDVVTVTEIGPGRYSTDIRRPTGARGGVHARTIGKDLYVIPDEVLPYLASGRLDRRLFDVTGLIEDGYDDRRSDGIPLIVSYADPASARRPAPAGATKVRSLLSVRGAAVRATKRQARRVWDAVTPDVVTVTPASADATPALADGISRIWLDGRVHADLADSTAQIGAPAAWAAGRDGAGVKVAVLDTGFDTDHPDLAGRVSASATFVPGETVEDGNGHGTHVASTVGGSGAASAGREQGVAPKADLVVGKILADEGYGADSWVIAGMEWAAAQGARVVSMSIGGDQSTDGTDPLSTAVNQLTAQTGALFVVAAGNAGAEGVISSPGAADAALTVAAVDSGDRLADFSSRGPRFGDYALKPDIAAPGVDILAAKAGGTAADGWYQSMSGTSMATPHVAGAAAILAQQHPDWRAAELKNALMSTASKLDGQTAYQVGAGRVDIPAGLGAAVTATGSAYFGFQGWPHDHLAPVDRTITYTNTGDVARTLRLAVTGEIAGGPMDADPHADEGKPAPGVFTLAAETLVVPAHGTASVTATAHPELGAAGRRYLGEVTATDAGGALARTTLGLYLEEERHDLTFSVTDRAGRYVAAFLTVQRFGEADPYFLTSSDTGPTTVRLRPGTYSVWSYLDVPGSRGPESRGTALLGDPEIVLDGDRTVNLDARKAVVATATVPERTEDRILMMDWYRSDGGVSSIDDKYILAPWVDTMYVLPTKQVTRGAFEYETRWRKAYPLLTVTDRGREVRFLGQPGSALHEGREQVDGVFAGLGRPADYAGRDVRGKVVLVNRSDELTNAERATAAADAGAELLVVVNDTPDPYSQWVGDEEGRLSRVPVVGVTSITGAPLVDRARRGQLRLGIEGTPSSPYTYDLVDPHPGRIPVDLAYRPRPKDLAVVEMRFHGDAPTLGGEFREDFRPYRTYSAGFPLWQGMQRTRTDHVSAQPGTTWREGAVGGREMELASVGERRAYRPGSSSTVSFFGPVTRPRDNASFYASERNAGWLTFNVQPWSDGQPGHAGFMQWGSDLALTVRRDGVEVAKVDGWAQATIEGNPEGVGHYSLDLTASRAGYRLSPRTHTTWEVLSPHVEDVDDLDVVAVLQLDYAASTDLAGDARGGRQHLAVTPSHLPGAAGAGTIAGTTLAVSFDDGAHWRDVTLVRRGGTWVADFVAPDTGYVSLRATAWDDAGNRVSQEITRAYGLATPGSR
ncbi:S8 family serine peptidase [Micromonospora chersina]|uniref:S8 family serine peptidase n=1 Tax=Micromonospora chersina TaxID=47854 RepID=UPI0036A9CA9A